MCFLIIYIYILYINNTLQHFSLSYSVFSTLADGPIFPPLLSPLPLTTPTAHSTPPHTIPHYHFSSLPSPLFTPLPPYPTTPHHSPHQPFSPPLLTHPPHAPHLLTTLFTTTLLTYHSKHHFVHLRNCARARSSIHFSTCNILPLKKTLTFLIFKSLLC